MAAAQLTIYYKSLWRGSAALCAAAANNQKNLRAYGQVLLLAAPVEHPLSRRRDKSVGYKPLRVRI